MSFTNPALGAGIAIVIEVSPLPDFSAARARKYVNACRERDTHAHTCSYICTYIYVYGLSILKTVRFIFSFPPFNYCNFFL